MFTYNHNGSLTNVTNDVFARATYHNHSTLPVSIVGSGGSASLCYDSMGRRAVKKGAVNISYRRGVDGDIVPLSENVGGEEVVYIETPSGHRLSRSSKIYYITSLDHLGSVRMRISVTSCVSAMYSAYGDCNVTTPLRYTFTGYELDSETNLMNAWRRIYSPKLARFVMVDAKLQNASPYLYCNGDPFNKTDPTGEISSAVISGIIAALVMVLSIVLVVVSEGTAAPEALESEIQLGSLAEQSQLANDIAAADSDTLGSASYTKSAMPTTRLGMAGAGAAMSGAGSAVSNAAGLVTKAANGEHISAWQGVKAMLIEPIISTMTGFIGGGIAGLGAMAFKNAAVTLGAYVFGAAVTSLSTTLLTDAVERQKVDSGELGLQLGVAVGEALLLSSVFTPVHPRAWFRYKTGLVQDDIDPLTERPRIVPDDVRETNSLRIHLTELAEVEHVTNQADANVPPRTRAFNMKAQKVRRMAMFKEPHYDIRPRFNDGAMRAGVYSHFDPPPKVADD